MNACPPINYFARRPDALVTSVRVTDRGAHRGITIWLKHHCVGELVIGEAELETFLEVLDVGPDGTPAATKLEER